MYTAKSHILSVLPKELLDLTWTCEDPLGEETHDESTSTFSQIYKPCGKCIPCITHATEKYRLSLIQKGL